MVTAHGVTTMVTEVVKTRRDVYPKYLRRKLMKISTKCRFILESFISYAEF